MIKKGPKRHRYVSLLSVMMVHFALLALVALGLFLATFIHRMLKNDAAYKAGDNPSITYDLFNLENQFNSYILIGSVFLIFIMLVFLLIRTIYVLNHPTTILLTLQYVSSNGDIISVTREVDSPKATMKKPPVDRFQKLELIDKKYPKKEHILSTEGLTLEYICRRFRSFASHIEGNPLFYSIDDIRRYIASLGVSKIIDSLNLPVNSLK